MSRRRVRGQARGGREWVGGRLSAPFFVTDRAEPYRPEIVVWLDLYDDLVVGQDVVGPENTADAVGRTLVAAMEHPLAGPPRRPDRIRVADASLAGEIRAALGDDTPVVVAPTPELDALLEAMLASVSQDHDRDDESYFEQGRIPAAAVAELFRSAELLYRIAPWKTATEGQLLRMDIPALGVSGACVSIIGSFDESLGLLIFPSLDGFDAFSRAANHLVPGNGPIDLGTDWLALSFERGADLPLRMRREAAQHGWPVVDANAYPRVDRRERDGAARPLVERDVKIASACASALTAFFVKHGSVFEADEFEAICESFFDERDLEVRFTLPYQAFALFGLEDATPRPPGAAPKVGRNDPCPCGSGRKYKKCHLASDETERASGSERSEIHDLDEALVRELAKYAMERFGVEWECFMEDFFDPEETLEFALTWAVYHYRVQGQSVLEWYLAEHGRQLSPGERSWFEAQQAAWLSVWEVIGVEAGKTLKLRDLLSHEERCVCEATASETLVVRDALLARVVDHEGVSLLCGVHPQPLSPMDAAEVVRRARGRLRRKRAVPVERLRDEDLARYLIRRWEDAVAESTLRAEIPQQLQNSDGDPLLLTTDHFEIEPAARAEVARCLAEMEGVEDGRPERGVECDGSTYVFLAEGNRVQPTLGRTVIGRAWLEDALLRLETNSRARADTLRARVEAACGGLLRHRAREHSDPLSSRAGLADADSPPEATPPEVQQQLREFKRRYYADWLDHALPALGGLSPREAVGTARGREAVDVLLKDMENHEQYVSAESAFDFGVLRRALRLD
jgi:hypothetical protein